MARNPTGVPGGRFFQYRNGLLSEGGAEPFYWKGMATKIDLGAQPPDRPRLVVNGRYRGGYIMARPPVINAVTTGTPPNYGEVFIGPQPVTIPIPTAYPAASTLQYTPTVIMEHASYAGLKLWWGAPIPTAGASTTETGGTVGFIDLDNAPEFSEVGRQYQTVDYTPHVEKYYNFVYVGGYGALRRIYQVKADPFMNPATLSEQPASEVVATFPGYQTLALHLHEGRLYFVIADAAGVADAKIYSWDGFSKTLELTLTGVTAASGASMCVYKSTLVVTVAGAGKIYVRGIDGVWNNYTLAGFDSSPVFNSMAVVKDKLYIADGATKIHSWNGTTLALEHTVTAGTSPGKLNVLCGFNGRLYYAWRDLLSLGISGDGNWPWLGMFDPDTLDAVYKWHDQYVAVATLVPDGNDTGTDYYRIAEPQAFAAYRGRLFLSISHRAACLGDALTEIDYTDVFTHSVENMPFTDFSTSAVYSKWYTANSTYLHINSVWIYNKMYGPVGFHTEGTGTDRNRGHGSSDTYRTFAYFKVF